MTHLNLIAARQNTHGDFTETAALADALREALRTGGPAGGARWRRLPVRQREALAMIALKMARIVCGDPDFADHWDDIAGYAALGAPGMPALGERA